VENFATLLVRGWTPHPQVSALEHPKRVGSLGRPNGSHANLRGQGPRAEVARHGSCPSTADAVMSDLQLP
jgi:hypothetical protein